jgi:hypothetical protein
MAGCALLAVAAGAGAAPDSRWFASGETETVKTYIQRGSLQQDVVDGEPGASVIGMAITMPADTTVVEKWHVSRRSCVAGAGQLHATTLAGQPKRTVEFVFGAGTLGAHQAELICDGYLRLPANEPPREPPR